MPSDPSAIARRTLLGALSLAAPAAAAVPCTAPDPKEEAAIRRVIDAMQAAWNRGDFAGYMAGFLNPGVVFVSKGRFQEGWQGTLDHYVSDHGGAPERRGSLRFFDLRIELLSPDAAQLIGRYELTGGASVQHGINTRLFRKVAGRWVIALNHVSAIEG